MFRTAGEEALESDLAPSDEPRDDMGHRFTIDGRVPADVGQARRIFASYDSGDVAKFEIMRMKKKSTVSWTVPAQTHMKMPGGMRWRPATGASEEWRNASDTG